jgi:hypothetical protein
MRWLALVGMLLAVWIASGPLQPLDFMAGLFVGLVACLLLVGATEQRR